ncbi:MAG: hypothetical protein AB2L11_04920 [Syntrophobacteraceae bacterium]
MVDRLLRLEKEVEELKETVLELRREISRLNQGQGLQKHPIEAILWQRGLPILSHGERSCVLLPPDSSPAREEIFYEHMRRYSFRLFLRELIRFPRGSDCTALSRYCSARTVRSYLKMLVGMNVVETAKDGGYRLLPGQIISFGPTLEWYVSKVFEREFLAPALFNIRLRNTRFGGDYDVISNLSGHLIYVEVKSSPPRGVELSAVSAFLKRLDDLKPHLAVFLVDTELRMRDKIVPLFLEALEPLGEEPQKMRIEQLSGEVFHIRHAIYLINSRKGIYSNLRQCFRDFLHHRTESQPLPEIL